MAVRTRSPLLLGPDEPATRLQWKRLRAGANVCTAGRTKWLQPPRRVVVTVAEVFRAQRERSNALTAIPLLRRRQAAGIPVAIIAARVGELGHW